MNLYTEKKLIDLWLPRERRSGAEINWESVVSRWNLLYIDLSYDPAIPLLGIYLEKTFLEKDTCTCMFITALFTIAKTWKQPKCPLTEDV